jgi:hypothetical protein
VVPAAASAKAGAARTAAGVSAPGVK